MGFKSLTKCQSFIKKITTSVVTVKEGMLEKGNITRTELASCSTCMMSREQLFIDSLELVSSELSEHE